MDESVKPGITGKAEDRDILFFRNLSSEKGLDEKNSQYYDREYI